MRIVGWRWQRLVVAAMAAAAWSGPAAGAAPKDKVPPLTIRACVDGGLLTGAVAASETTSSRSYAPRYRLTGPRALVREIKREHTGHLDEFTGTTSGDFGTGTGPSVDLGGVSVGVGIGAGGASGARVPETPVFEVTAFKHTDVACR